MTNTIDDQREQFLPELFGQPCWSNQKGVVQKSHTEMATWAGCLAFNPFDLQRCTLVHGWQTTGMSANRIMLMTLSRSCLPTVCFVHWAFKFQLEIQLGANTDNDTGRVNASQPLGGVLLPQEGRLWNKYLWCGSAVFCLSVLLWIFYLSGLMTQRKRVLESQWPPGQFALVCIASMPFLLGRVSFLSGVVLRAQVSV